MYVFADWKAYALRFEHALARLQLLRVLLPSATDIFPLVPPILSQDGVAHDPRRKRDVDEGELLAQEVRALNLLNERSESSVVLLEVRLLLFCILSLDEPHKARDDLLGHMIGPETDICTIEWVGREDVWLMVRERVLEELTQDQRLVQGLPLVFNRWDKSLGVYV